MKSQPILITTAASLCLCALTHGDTVAIRGTDQVDEPSHVLTVDDGAVIVDSHSTTRFDDGSGYSIAELRFGAVF